MVGLSSFLIETMGVLGPLALLCAGVAMAWRRRQVGPLALAAAGALFFALTGIRFVHQIDHHRFLSRLGSAARVEIAIAGSRVEDPRAVAAITERLQHWRWYSSNHGGWARSVPLVIAADGQTRYFLVGRHLEDPPGAVLELRRGPGRSGWSDGYAFAPALHEALDAWDLGLPGPGE